MQGKIPVTWGPCWVRYTSIFTRTVRLPLLAVLVVHFSSQGFGLPKFYDLRISILDQITKIFRPNQPIRSCFLLRKVQNDVSIKMLFRLSAEIHGKHYIFFSNF